MNLNKEKRLGKKGYGLIAGLDEAGRGPLAGPVVAAALVVRNCKSQTKNTKELLKKVKDSKKLTSKKREEIYGLLKKNPNVEWGIGVVSEKTIDRINILEATKLAMMKAIKSLKKKNKKLKINYLILDGNFEIDTDIPQKPIKQADAKIFSCAAASIIAKVSRDRLMDKYDKIYPEYGFNQHKGYPTKLHRRMIKKHGPCKIHRITFSLT